jgi:hypothetical protein
MSERRTAPEMQIHLNDEQFCALLAGEESTSTAAHLDGCAACRSELERVAGPMEGFSALGMEWAERRSATLAPVRPQTAWAKPLMWPRPLTWAASALLAAAVIAGVHRERTTPAPLTAETASGRSAAAARPAVAASGAAESPRPRTWTREQQIAEDNRMLLAIRQELTRPETLMLPPSGARSARTARAVND